MKLLPPGSGVGPSVKTVEIASPAVLQEHPLVQAARDNIEHVRTQRDSVERAIESTWLRRHRLVPYQTAVAKAQAYDVGLPAAVTLTAGALAGGLALGLFIGNALHLSALPPPAGFVAAICCGFGGIFAVGGALHGVQLARAHLKLGRQLPLERERLRQEEEHAHGSLQCVLDIVRQDLSNSTALRMA